MYRFEMPARHYAATGHVVSTEESRPVLNGVHFQVRDTCLIACGTDGHALVMTRSPLPYPEDGSTYDALSEEGVILPPVKLSALGVTAKGLDTDYVTFESADGMSWTISARCKGRYGMYAPSSKLSVVRAIEGPFPDVRQVIPRAGIELAPLPSLCFDPEVLDKAAHYFGKVSLGFTGSERAVIVIPWDRERDNMMGLMMPVRPLDASAAVAPSWVHAAPDPVAVDAEEPATC